MLEEKLDEEDIELMRRVRNNREVFRRIQHDICPYAVRDIRHRSHDYNGQVLSTVKRDFIGKHDCALGQMYTEDRTSGKVVTIEKAGYAHKEYACRMKFALKCPNFKRKEEEDTQKQNYIPF